MAGRPPKEGLDYFELDCHMDEKVRKIQAEFGLKGIAVFVLLLQRIYGEKGYYCPWNDDELLLFMSDTGATGGDRNLINEIVLACIRRDIFSHELYEKYGILTSSGIQKRYFRATSRRGWQNVKEEYLLVSVGKNSINVSNNSINVSNNSISACRNATREEKDKINKYFSCPELDLLFKKYVESRPKPFAGKAIELSKRDLMVLAGNDDQLAIEIVTQTLKHGWKSFYPIKDKKSSSKRKKTNKFQNFTERDTDYNALADDLMKSQKPL